MDLHLPSIMIFSGEQSFRNSAIAAPDLIDLFPISSGLNPNRSLLPWAWQTFRNSEHVYACVMELDLYLLLLMEQIGVRSFTPTQNRRTWMTALPNRRTGQSLLCLVLLWVLNWNF